MSSTARDRALPLDCWYAIGPSDAIGRMLLPIRAVGRPLVLYRTQDGAPVALEDRCAHRSYPLSAGTLIEDGIRCGLCGFGYDATGQCISVPTQARVPYGAHVHAFPVRESDGLVWAWFGEPGRSRLHRVPELPWLADPGWSTVNGEQIVDAGYLLLQESFADVTQVPFVAPEIAPSVLGVQPPPLDVIVTETTVTINRTYPAGPLPQWQAALAGVPGDRPYRTEQAGFFPSPAAWIDHWDAQDEDGNWIRLRFTQLVTPIDTGRTHLMWRVSRDFAVGDQQATERVRAIFADYYARVIVAMQTAQAVIDRDGPGPEVNVTADAAGLKVREIIAELLAEQG